MFHTFAVLFPGENAIFYVVFHKEKPLSQRVLADVAQLARAADL